MTLWCALREIANRCWAQRRRGANVGPGTAWTLGFWSVHQKQNKKREVKIFSLFWSVLQKTKKGLQGKTPRLSPDSDVFSKQKMVFTIQWADFSVWFWWIPRSPLARGHCPSCPPPIGSPGWARLTHRKRSGSPTLFMTRIDSIARIISHTATESWWLSLNVQNMPR